MGIIWWILLILVQYHIYKKDIYFQKKEEAFKILELLDRINHKLSEDWLINNDIKKSEDITKNFFCELENRIQIYFPLFMPQYQESMVANGNAKRIINMSDFLSMEETDKKHIIHNKELKKTKLNILRKHEKWVISFKKQFITYLDFERNKLFFWFKKFNSNKKHYD